MTLFAACAFEDLRCFKGDAQVIDGLLEPLSCLTILGASSEEMVHSLWDCAGIAQPVRMRFDTEKMMVKLAVSCN